MRTASRSGLSPKLLATGFGLSQGAESDVIQEDKGEYSPARRQGHSAPAADPGQGPRQADPVLPADRDAEAHVRQARQSDRPDQEGRKPRRGRRLGGRQGQSDGHDPPAGPEQQSDSPEQLAKIFGAKAGDLFASGAAVVKVASVQSPPCKWPGRRSFRRRTSWRGRYSMRSARKAALTPRPGSRPRLIWPWPAKRSAPRLTQPRLWSGQAGHSRGPPAGAMTFGAAR